MKKFTPKSRFSRGLIPVQRIYLWILIYLSTILPDLNKEPFFAGPFDSSNEFSAKYEFGGQQSIDQRQAEILHLEYLVLHANSTEAKAQAQANLDAEISSRMRVDSSVRETTRLLLSQPSVTSILQVDFSS